MFFAATGLGDAAEAGGYPVREQVIDLLLRLDEGVAGFSEEDDAFGLVRAAVDVFAGFVAEDGIGHAVNEEERLVEVLDLAGAMELGRERGDAADRLMEFAGFDDDGPAEAVPDEDDIGSTDAFHEGTTGESVEDALFEFIGLAILEAEDGDLRAGEEDGETGVEAVGGAIEPAHGAAHADDGGSPALDRVEDAFDFAAGGFEPDAKRAGVVERLRPNAKEAEVEVLLRLFFGFVPHVSGHAATIRGR